MTYDIWSTLGAQLEGQHYANYYLTHEKYKGDNPLESLVALPGITKFFGTRVLNLFIVSRTYGYNEAGDEEWPPPGLTESIAHHKATFVQFTSYKTYIFMDFNFVTRVGNAGFSSKMEQTSTRLEQMCTELAEYGFVFGPRIETAVGHEFFAPYLDLHFGQD